MSAMSWQFVAASKHHPKKMQSGAGKSRCGDGRNRSLRMSQTSLLSMSPGSVLEISWKFYATGLPRPANRPAPADAIQSSMTIGSAI
jgi:hypothetical protein